MVSREMGSTKTQKQVVGGIGEDLAARFLVGKGYEVLGRNYRKKFGELDIVAKKAEKIYFVEVKTVSRDLKLYSGDVSDAFRPEDNVHPWKQKRLSRALQVYLSEYKLEDCDWQFDVITVFLDMEHRLARVKVIEDVIL